MIFQDDIPYDVTQQRPLPGIAPFEMRDWLHVDSAYAAQMARRRHLLSERLDDVLRLQTEAVEAAQELVALVLAHLPTGFVRRGNQVTCPDGERVALDMDDPLGTLGQMMQEDFCILQKQGDEHVLTGAVLCFPASWRLSEKIGRPLLGIHEPVADFDAKLGARVQRMFDGVKPDRPLTRFNALWYQDPELFQPRSETDPRPLDGPRGTAFLRSERQCILRLAQSNAVVFSIHTYVVDGDNPKVTA